MTTAEVVVEILTNEGKYRSLETPVKIGSQEYSFDYALVATEKANDLVLVIELTGKTKNDAVVRSVLAFTRALDVIGSRRPVTTVLTSGEAAAELLTALGRVCRVLPIGAPQGDDARQTVRDWLAALLPLESPPPVEHLAEWRQALQKNLSGTLEASQIEEFIDLAQIGIQAVEEALEEAVSSRAELALETDESK